ncbi:glycosyltransferase family 2 protein [Desulfobacula sp.]|uniref:glycosyltransferase family 2 protein n=1 Tax=Desulfobacula sp. TaxID=2593537 RepID=UPI002634DCCC|nr:glycosyltransferase family 2 protein [Desulfobacula sp.]
MKKISIIISSYNYEKYIESCVLSCLNQEGFDNFEVIVVDDGSQDASLEILKKYAHLIRLFKNSNHGLEYELNYAIRKADGDYIVRVDADDKLDKRFLNLTYPKIHGSKYAFVYPEYSLINEQDEIISDVKLPDFNDVEIKKRGDFLATGTLYNKKQIAKVGLYNEAVKNCGLENYELILNLLSNNCNGLCIHQKLFYYRQHNTNLSIKRKKDIIAYGKKLAIKFNLSGYQTNEFHPWGLTI